MWDKLNIFGWSSKKPTPQPVQKEISINITNGDRKETIQRSPSGTKLAASSIAKNRVDDDDSSDGSTSINFGLKVGPVPRRASSFSFSREPLDLPTWSNVTSPGFTSRLVQQASGHSPLKEFNDSISNSPFRKSPYKDMSLGELPFVNFSKSRASSPPTFSSFSRMMKPGVTSSIYNRDRRRNARQGQVFVRIAPIDPSKMSIKSKAPTPPVGVGMGSGGQYPPRGSPRAGSEGYRPDGLGGIPQQELAMRFNRMWPNSPPGSPVPGPGRPLSPTAPSNVMEALASGRKRVREHEPYYPPNATPPSVSPPSKISIGIGDTPVRPHQQMSKRVKFGLSAAEGHDRPMMVPYSGMGGNDHEPLSSESILEQMNQTERRFLPDSTSTPASLYKKPIRMSEEPQPSTSASLRKRRHQFNVMNPVDEELKGEKFGRYCCPCNECYAEATGNGSFNLSSVRDGSVSPTKSSSEVGSPSKNSTLKSTCDVGVGPDYNRAAYFKELFKKADRKKKSEADEENADVMKYGRTVVTKEMYERDKIKRVERYYRLQNMKPPGPGETLYENPADLKKNESKANESVASPSSAPSTSNGFSNEPASTTANSGFSFGSPANNTGGGFSFGKRTSPVAQTMTTSVCPTITSPSITASIFTGLASTAPSASIASIGSTPTPVPTTAPPAYPGSLQVSNNLFGSPTTSTTEPSASQTQAVESTTSTPAPTSTTEPATAGISFGASTAPSFNFSSGSNPLAQPKPKEATSTTTAAASPGGFSFSGGATTTTPFLGFGAAGASATTTAESKPAESAPATTTATFGSFGAAATSTVPSFGLSAAQSQSVGSTGGFSFAQSTASVAASSTVTTTTTTAQVVQSNTTNIFGIPNPVSTSATATASTVESGPTKGFNPSFQFGQSSGTGGGFSFAASKVAEDKTDGKGNETVPTTVTAGAFTSGTGGFSFATATTTSGGGGFSFSKTNVQPSTTTNPTTTSSNAPPNIFGGLSSNTMPTTTSTTTSLFSMPAATTTSSSQGGSIFGGLGNTGSAVTTTTSSFGMGATQGTGLSSNPSGSSQQPSLTLGSIPSFSAGQTSGFAFGGGAQAKPNETQSSTTSGNTGGFNFGGAASPPAFGGFGAAAPATTSQTSTTTNTFGSFRPSFPSVPNPLANKSPPPSGATSPFGSGAFGASSPATTTAAPTNPPAFGSFGAASPPAFGSGNNNNLGGTQGGGFSFGQNTMSVPQPAQPSSGGFGFGSQPVQSTPAPQPSSGFAFGQAASPVTAPAPQPSPGGVFQFGQQNAAASPAPFQFGQQAAQGVPGGFNFAAAAPAPGGQAMFSVGTSSTAPRRRDVRRRHR